MSGSSNNSWTFLTPEETAAAETLRPLTEGTERQDELSAPTEGFGEKPSDGAEMLSVEDRSTSEEKISKPNEEGDCHGCEVPKSAVLEVISGPVSQIEAATVDSALSSTEPESFSDSYTHLSPSSDESPASPLTTETLGHLDLVQGEEVRGQTDIQDDTQHQTMRQEFQQEEEESELPQWTNLETPQDSTVQTEVVEDKTETAAQEAEPEVRMRRSLIATLEKIGRHDEEEEAEEDFQLPQREEDTGITLNKCILGAVILLGLGTIFISESDYATRELNGSEAPVKQEWANPDVAQPPAEADPAELLNKLPKGNEHIALLQAQLQSQNEELKVAKAQAVEGTTERLREEEMEKENSRLKKDMETLPVLQKELEKMKRELESVSVLQKEVESLRSTLTQLKLSSAVTTTPPSGHTEDNSQKSTDKQVLKKDKQDRGERKKWKDAEGSEWKNEKKHRKDGGKMEGKDKEWKKDKSESGRFDKRRKGDKHLEHSEEPKEWKKDKLKRGDEGKPWKDKNVKKEWTDKSDKKSKYDKLNENKQWRSKEEKQDLKEGKHYGERHKGHGDKQWKKGKEGRKEEGKDKFERRHWKEREGWEDKNHKNNGERKEWSENNWKDSKDEKKWKEEDRKQWRKDEEVWKGGAHKEKKYKDEWHKDESGFEKQKHKGSDHKDHTWTARKPAHSHHKPSPGQPEYWAHQRERLQHSTRPLESCSSLDACAQAEGLRPVHFTEFETILQNYLSKAQTAGVDASQIDELQKLATESFKNGVFVHDQISFQDYVEDVGDILEDLVEGENSDGDQDGAIEDEMEGFEQEVMQTFILSGSGEQERVKGEWRKESGRGHG